MADITVTAYGIPNSVSTCFTKKLVNPSNVTARSVTHQLKSSCIFNGYTIDLIKVILDNTIDREPTFIKASTYGECRNGTCSGMLGDVQTERANLTIPNLHPSDQRTESVELFSVLLLPLKQYFVINPRPNFSSIHILQTFPLFFWLTSLFIYLLTASLVLFHQHMGYQRALYSLLFEQRSRKIWKSFNEKCIVTIWSLVVVRVLYASIKINFYKHFKSPRQLPDTAIDLEQYSPMYSLVFSLYGANYDKLLNPKVPKLLAVRKALESTTTLMSGHKVATYVGNTPGAITTMRYLAASSLQQKYKHLIIRELKSGEDAYGTMFVSKSTGLRFRNKLSSTSIRMADFGIVSKLINRYTLSDEKDTKESYEALTMMTFHPSFVMFAVMLVACWLALIAEKLSDLSI